MSWHFLQGQGEESWEGISLDGAPSALLSLLPTPDECFWLVSEMGSSRIFQSGMTFAPSTENHGEDGSMSSAEDSLAPTFQPPERALESTARTPVSGARWLESLARYDRATSSWRTLQCSLLGDLEEYSETWPRWGSMRTGECWERTMPALLTEEIESGSWATPQARDYRTGGG